MFLILASMPVLNLLTKYTTTPTINFQLFPWPPPFAALSSSRAETAPVFFTAQEMPGWQQEKGLDFNWMLRPVAVAWMWPTVKSSHILDLQLRVATGKASHGSNQTLKVTTTTEGQKQQSHELRKGKIFGTYSFFFLLQTAQFSNLLRMRNISSVPPDFLKPF